LYPNPSVLAAALSALTHRIRIRAGSVVAPLHHPIRIAEEWSIVDNLSGGRVELSFASGYHPGDFTLSPASYADRKEIMFQHVDSVRRLWAGEEVTFCGVEGQEVPVRTLPRPIQRELPVWITSAGSEETWIRAAKIGAHVLTGLAGIGRQSIDTLATRISQYRERLADYGHATAKVALMLHAYVGVDAAGTRDTVRKPISEYVRTFIEQGENLVPSASNISAGLSQQDKESLAEMAFQRFIETNGLLGTVEKCTELTRVFQSIGVDELACLVDFGLDDQTVLSGLELLDSVRARFCRSTQDPR
jgi:natural product biosynthesis luciferase-like monooxygenase protein